MYSVRTADKLFQTRTAQYSRAYYSAGTTLHNELLLYKALQVLSAVRAGFLLCWLYWTGKQSVRWKYLRQAECISCPSIREVRPRTYVRTCCTDELNWSFFRMAWGDKFIGHRFLLFVEKSVTLIFILYSASVKYRCDTWRDYLIPGYKII